MRVIFMGTPEFAVPSLERLIHSEYRPIAVYTQPDRPAGRGRKVTFSPAKEKAVEHNVPVYQPVSLRKPEEVQTLRELNPDVMVVAAFGQILRREVLEIPPYGCINIHASLLPKHRGAAPIAAAILDGDEKTGITIMLMDPGMDTGPILSQAEEPVYPSDTTGSLSLRLAELGANLLMETLPRWLKGEISPQPQDDSKATYTRLLTKDEGDIDWNASAEEIWRQVRAFQPWPGCHSHWDEKLLKIKEALPVQDGPSAAPGTVVMLSKPVNGSRLAVATGKGYLVLKSLQLEGKREMSADEFLRGQKEIVGAKLERLETKL